MCTMAEEDLNIEPREPLELRMCMVSAVSPIQRGHEQSLMPHYPLVIILN